MTINSHQIAAMTTRARRMLPKDRRALMLECAVQAALRHGWMQMTRANIAALAEVSEALVTRRLGTMDDVRREVMRLAVKRPIPAIVAVGLAMGDKIACKASDAVKDAARKAL